MPIASTTRICALAASPPPYAVPDCPGAHVPLYIDSPVHECSREKLRANNAELLGLVSVLELCLARQDGIPSSSLQSSRAASANATKIAALRTEIDKLLSRISTLRPVSLPRALADVGLDQVFPLSSEYMGPSDTSATFDLRSVSVLNQVVTLALQLRHDVELQNHKYIAHQVALLYQSLTHSRDEIKRFRPIIETQFEQIKASCSAAVAEPRLTAEQREWLRLVTTDVITEALFKGHLPSASAFLNRFLRKL